MQALDLGNTKQTARLLYRRPQVCSSWRCLPLAVRLAGSRGKILELDIFGRQVIDGRMAGFENALGPAAVGNNDAAEDDLNVLISVFKARRAGVIPD